MKGAIEAKPCPKCGVYVWEGDDSHECKITKPKEVRQWIRNLWSIFVRWMSFQHSFWRSVYQIKRALTVYCLWPKRWLSGNPQTK